MRVDRTKVRLVRRGEEGPPEEAMDFLWELSREMYSLAGYDVDAPIRRDVVVIHRKNR